MANELDAYEFVQHTVPVKDERTPEQIAEDTRQGAFREEAVERGRSIPGRAHLAMVAPKDVCLLDERGGHIRQGDRCPHFSTFTEDRVYTAEEAVTLSSGLYPSGPAPSGAVSVGNDYGRNTR